LRFMLLGAMAVALMVVGCGADAATQTCAELLKSGTASGTCERDGGQRMVVSPPRGSAEIDDLRIRYRKWWSVDILLTPRGRVRADHRFVIVRVAITNLGDRARDIGIPQETRFDRKQRWRYGEDREASSGPVPDAFLAQRPGTIAPGETVTGAFVYDMPEPIADATYYGGATVWIGGFDDRSIDAADEIAVLRLGRGAG
jgi:hypothetical protein